MGAGEKMNKITLETSKVEGKIYYKILVDGNIHAGTYVFETALSNWIELKGKLEFPNL